MVKAIAEVNYINESAKECRYMLLGEDHRLYRAKSWQQCVYPYKYELELMIPQYDNDYRVDLILRQSKIETKEGIEIDRGKYHDRFTLEEIIKK